MSSVFAAVCAERAGASRAVAKTVVKKTVTKRMARCIVISLMRKGSGPSSSLSQRIAVYSVTAIGTLVNMYFRFLIYGGLLASLLSAQSSPTPARSNPSTFALIEDLVTANHILANEGVLDGYGHVSVRSPGNPNHYFLARAGAPGLVNVADIVEYDLDSNAVSNTAVTGYTERFIHGEIYKARPEIMA